MVKPLPSSYQIDNLKDAEVATSFSANDFSWKDGKLSMDVFSEDLYDSAEVSKLFRKSNISGFDISCPKILLKPTSVKGLMNLAISCSSLLVRLQI